MKSNKSERQLALEAGQKEYYTKDPCLRGHYEARITITGRCKECIREDARNKYKQRLSLLEGASKND